MISKIHIHQDYVKKYIQSKKTEKEKYFYLPTNRFLTVMACHVSNDPRLQVIKNNIKYLKFDNNDIVIIMTADLPLNNKLKEICDENKIKYFEMVNNKWFDFGKWLHVLKNIDYSIYEFIHFTNDSFSIHSQIDHFFNLAKEKNVEMYAYTSSSEMKYHYQSYLFIVKINAISKFIDYVKDKTESKKSFDLVNIELNLSNAFESKDCFLDLGKNGYNINKNIFFTNNELYYPLFNSSLLPFIKIKRTKCASASNSTKSHKKILYNSFFCW